MRVSGPILLLAAALTAVTSLPAAAHDHGRPVHRPYVIEQTCDTDFDHCRVRMSYEPGQNPGLARPGSYFYARSTGRVEEAWWGWCGIFRH